MRIPLFWFDRVGKKDKDSLGTELAEFVSTITDPLLITIVTLLVILKSISMTFKEATFWFLLVMGISIVPTALYIFLGMKLAWLFIFLPLVGWARTKLKKHTWGQVIVGALMSLLITWLVFKMYNYVGI